ncbi:hypothetical protein [Agrobacterium arsenijevicii]|uniref:Uncharacterized protein n=1 Tax=Agrobacterium arsenijevicii TaxID=1585697 RepID=A0ABR5D560_9HYPH|nr:hypothetical protein RP75_16040 [Agrobacterium arsenijevicii]
MKSASILFGLIASFLMNSQDVYSQPVSVVVAQLTLNCQFEIPPCEQPNIPPGSKPPPSPVAPPPAPGGGGIHNLPGAPVLKETIIIPGNNMLKEFKLDQPKILEMQRQLQNR